MSYLTQSFIAENRSMNVRVAQCAAQQGQTSDPDRWAYENRRVWSSSPGWDASWESAEVGDPGADHGANEAVITDGNILSQVQSMLTLP